MGDNTSCMRTPIALVVTMVIGGCSTAPSSALLSPPTAPTPASSLFVASVTLDRRALNGGDSTAATISLNAPAPTATVIAMSSDISAAMVPGSVTIAAGSAHAALTIGSTPVDQDVTATITATLNGRSAGNRLAIWAVEPNSFWYDSDVGEGIGLGRADRVTSANALLRAGCAQSDVQVEIIYPSGIWNVRFHLPSGVPIRPGTWGFSPGIDFSRPFLQLGGLGRGCSAGGEFTIVEADLEPAGTVVNFVATFKQACAGTSPVLRGEVRVRNPPSGSGGATPSNCLR